MKTALNVALFLCALFLSSAVSFAQNERLKTYQKELDAYKENDTIKVGILHDLAFEYYYVSRDSSMFYFKEARELSVSLDFKKGIAATYLLQGMLEIQQGNYEFGRESAQKAKDIFEQIQDKQGLSVCNNSLGNSYMQESKYKEAIPYFENQITPAKTQTDSINLVASHLSLANSYSGLGEYDTALIHLNSCLEISRALDYIVGISYALNTQGMIFEELGNYPQALSSYEESLELKTKHKDSLGMSKTYNALGNLYKKQEQLDKALYYYEQSLSIGDKFQSKDGVATSQGNIGMIYNRKKEYQKAFEYANKSLALSLETGNTRGQSNAYSYLGTINKELLNLEKARNFFLLAEKVCIDNDYKTDLCKNRLAIAETYILQKNHSEALSYVNLAQIPAQKYDLLEEQKDIAFFLSQIYENKKDYGKALENHRKFKTLNDSLFNKENIEKITALQYEYKYKRQLDSANMRENLLKKTVKNTEQNLEASQQKLLLGIIGFLVISLILGAIIFILRLRNISVKNQNIITEQKLLRTQMTPHFIFNALSVLQGMILSKDFKKSVQYLSKFSKLLRITLENSRDKKVLLDQELIALENYIELQNIEAIKPYQYSLELDSNINRDDFLVPPMLLQPFVENAVEHAFRQAPSSEQITQREKKIEVRLVLEGPLLKCTISDNGMGVRTQLIEKRTDKNSLSTTITSERLEILSKSSKVKGGITIEDRSKYNEQGTLVTLLIPYKLAS